MRKYNRAIKNELKSAKQQNRRLKRAKKFWDKMEKTAQ